MQFRPQETRRPRPSPAPPPPALFPAAVMDTRRTMSPHDSEPKNSPLRTISVQTPVSDSTASASARRRGLPSHVVETVTGGMVGMGLATLSTPIVAMSLRVLREQADNQAVAQVPALAPGGLRGVVVEPVGAEHLPVVAAAGLARLRLQPRRVEVALDAFRPHLLGATEPEDGVGVPLPLGGVAPMAQGADRRADHRGDVLARRQGPADPRRAPPPADPRRRVHVVDALGREFGPGLGARAPSDALPPHPPAADGALGEREKGADAAVD